MDENQIAIYRMESETIAKVLAAWPYLDERTRENIAEYSNVRFPNMWPVFEPLSKAKLNLPQSDIFPALCSVICESKLDVIAHDTLPMFLQLATSKVFDQLGFQQAPYNLIYIQERLLDETGQYLSKLYSMQGPKILDDLRIHYPDLKDLTEEVLRLNKIFSLNAKNVPQSFADLKQLAKTKKANGFPVISTGFKGIDEKINEGGYAPKRLTIIEAKTGLGKTSFVSQTLCNAALAQNQSVLLLSLEMDEESSMVRMLSQATQISPKQLVQMLEADEPTEHVQQLIDRLDKLVSIRYPDNQSDVGYIERQILDYLRIHGRPPALVVVDYIQQLTMGQSGRHSSHADELTAISRTLRGYAQQFNTHLIITSQVMETSDGISRSFGASGIEFAADHVLVLMPSKLDENKRILKFKKNRFGPSGDEIELIWQAGITSFLEFNPLESSMGVSLDMLTTRVPF